MGVAVGVVTSAVGEVEDEPPSPVVGDDVEEPPVVGDDVEDPLVVGDDVDEPPVPAVGSEVVG